MESNRSLFVLKKAAQYQHLKKVGRRSHPSSWLLVNYSKNTLGRLRVGWTIPRYVGGAVVRNKIKRWCRESFREWNKKDLNLNCDVNFIFKKQREDFYKHVEYQEFKKSVDHFFKKQFKLD